jgi:hypothetical protein
VIPIVEFGRDELLLIRGALADTASIKDLQFPPARTRSEDSGQSLSIQSEKALDFNVKGNRKDFVSLTL